MATRLPTRAASRLIGAALCWISALSSASPPDDASVILVLGDSLSAAYGIDTERGWVHLLQQRLDAVAPAYTVVNTSVSGEVTANGRERLPALLRRYSPDIVILELGANDGLRGLAPAAMRENLGVMIESSRAVGAEVLLLGMRLPPNYGPAYTRLYEQSFIDVAQRHEVPLLPFFLDGVAENAGLLQADRLHPTAAAQPRLLDNVWTMLEPMLTLQQHSSAKPLSAGFAPHAGRVP